MFNAIGFRHNAKNHPAWPVMTLTGMEPGGGRDALPGSQCRSAKPRVMNEAAVIHEPATPVNRRNPPDNRPAAPGLARLKTGHRPPPRPRALTITHGSSVQIKTPGLIYVGVLFMIGF